MRTEIIYEDKDILVIYKPAGLATQTAKLGQADVVSQLKNYLAKNGKSAGPGPGRDTYLGIIHRLDQPVEGLLVFAKNKKAAADLTAQLQSQGQSESLHKHYYAVVCGKPVQNAGRLVDYMYKSQDNLAVIVEEAGAKGKSDGTGFPGEAVRSNAGKQAKEAILEYCIKENRRIVGGKICSMAEEEDAEQAIALADINILTGRFHQIRAQMSHAGMPLLGDAKYGPGESRELARALGVQNVALCAYCLEFKHPVTGKTLRFEEKPRGKVFGYFL